VINTRDAGFTPSDCAERLENRLGGDTLFLSLLIGL